MKQVKRSTFKLLFYLKKNAPKKNGMVAIMGRITINGKVAQFSTKLEILPDRWNLKYGRVSGRTEDANHINNKLEDIRTRISQTYDEIIRKEGFATAQKVKNSFLGIGSMEETLLKVYESFNQDFGKMVEKGIRRLHTYNKYLRVYDLLSEFIDYKYHKKDIVFKQIKHRLTWI